MGFGLTWFQIKQHVQSLSVIGNLFIQTGQIKLVLNVVLVHLTNDQYPINSQTMENEYPEDTNLTEELVASQATEPGNPRNFLRATHCSVWTNKRNTKC